MDNNEIKDSLTKQVSGPVTFEVTETTTVIKEYNGTDLPLYFKWTLGTSPWYYRVRNKEGRIVTDLLKTQWEGLYELHYSTVNSAFSKSNETITEDEWRNEMHKFINQIK